MNRNEVSVAVMLEALIKGILQSGTMTVIDGSLAEQIGDLVDQESHEALSPEALSRRVFRPDRHRLLDFGCGTGAHRKMLETIGYDWRGVNYLEGMEAQVRSAASADARIDFYDGRHLPYETGSFGTVYSFQTFEHIQDISVTFSELRRVLQPGGVIIGACSYLEQMHDYSTFNFTPYGLKLAAQQSGMRLTNIYPSYDVFTWMFRRLLVSTSGADANSATEILARDSAIHQMLQAYASKHGLSPKDSNLLRLMFSAHITFRIERP